MDGRDMKQGGGALVYGTREVVGSDEGRTLLGPSDPESPFFCMHGIVP